MDDVKNYMYFKKGSYWIYQHDITNEIDSQWVEKADLGQSIQKGTMERTKHITLVQETFYMNIRSNFVDGHGNISYWNIWNRRQDANAYPYISKDYLFIKQKSDKGPMGTCGDVDVFWGDYSTNPKRSVYQVNLLTNYKLNNLTFDTVRVFRVGNECVMQQCKYYCWGGKCDYYYAKGIGIIKIHNESFRWSDGAPMNHSWNLIRYKIVK